MFEGTRLLVVEDDPVLAMMWQEIFTHVGAVIFGPCASAAHALETLRTETLELALLDVQIRDGDSFPVARALRELHIPFLFHSSTDQADLPREFSTAHYLRKPASARDLFAALAVARGQ